MHASDRERQLSALPSCEPYKLQLQLAWQNMPTSTIVAQMLRE